MNFPPAENSDRRRFDRAEVPPQARVYALDHAGVKLGAIRQIGRGGLLVDTRKPFAIGTKLTLKISDEREGILREVQAVVRYLSEEGLGCEFERLDADAAVEVGVLLGRFYKD